jgi:hypothetical protein
LVIEKTPFVDPTRSPEGNAVNGVSEAGSEAFFELAIPGHDGDNSFRNEYRNRDETRTYTDWQASQGITEGFTGRSDTLRAGEPLHVVAINRATGYVGSIRTPNVSDGINTGVELDKLVLYPPNLKVRVERRYQVQRGLTQGEDRRYLVGTEGAALSSDQYVSVHTEWLDHQGGQLPAGLPGFTARLSSLVATNTLNDAVEHFEIKPGKHIQVLELVGGSMSSIPSPGPSAILEQPKLSMGPKSS